MLAAAGCGAEYNFPDDVESGFGRPNAPDLASRERVDRIVQVIPPIIDILFVIDSSPSMTEDRQSLARAFPHFISPFEQAATDWHVGVITTDMETEGHQGKLQERSGVRWLEPGVDDFERIFQEMATTIDTDATEERGREAAWMALEIEADGFNEGFLRDYEGGWLHITVVTDEDDDTEDQVISIDRFADYLDLIKPYADRTTFNSVVALQTRGPEIRGDSYIELTERVGGEVYDVNSGDWIGLLDDLAALQAPEPQTEFFLSAVPVPDTIDVVVVTPDEVTLVYVQDVDYSWSRTRNSVQFVEAPPIGSSIEITYTIAAD